MRLSISLLALSAASALAAPYAQVTRTHQPRDYVQPTAFAWNDGTIRGLNLGGWLVMEPWITRSIFDKYQVVDEYTLAQKLGDDTLGVLQPHWDSWVTQEDINKIASYGFNMVRVPIGFWAFDNAGLPYKKGSAPYLDKAIEWARQAQPPLKVVIDLHGAPGSQNGFDNSGQKMNTAQWQSQDSGAKRTLAVLQLLQSKYGDASYDDVVMGIELLNEPNSGELDINQIKQFVIDGYNQQRNFSQSRVVVMHDAFKNTNYYNDFLTPSSSPSANNIAIDHHEYQVFSPDQVALSTQGHLDRICSQESVYNGANKWTFVGEWSAAMTDCAPYLNGFGIGSRYAGNFTTPSKAVGSCDKKNLIKDWDQQMKDDTRAFIEAQMDSYERNTRGWTFWNFKTENSAAAEWDAFALIEAKIFPQPLTDRKTHHKC
ncbi:glycoside hydrolase family 5 protein [Myriangium duriaei CBS 260.36]|uniref:Glycoside hydrolase family 5 protein n=1 Tax=Myriangium duriaei CBS 260.36 TaxID=1168546 RepID=A0A9P4MCM6_9PEZI|nr:glycoside hydrolase family 5 protein [Myriangium duriaei CBS 260.36]